MDIVGIIAEYNPLHNGHMYQLKKIDEMYPNNLKVVILSSEFSERGELCVFNKFIRSRQALDAGVNLVLSNPVYYSMNNASSFAYSNVYFLNQAKCNIIVCGIETDSTDLFIKMYKVENTSIFKEKLANYLKLGHSFKDSYLKSFEELNIKFKSNDLLAYFYYTAIQKINKKIKLVTIKRINNDYKDQTLNDTNIQSASALRKTSDISKYVPSLVNNDYKKYKFRDINKLVPLIKYASLFQINSRENTEGLSNKLKEIAYKTDYYQIVDQIKSKRYSEAKINRFIISQLFRINTNNNPSEKYIRVIGFDKRGQELLKEIKDDTTIYTSIKENINYEFDLEILIDKTLDIIYDESLLKKEIKGPIIK